jgi:pimeloyl-ACP methyl ester carboxylesterase
MTLAAAALLVLCATPGPSRSPSPPDTLLDVGGYRLHFAVYRGTRSLTIVMESGGGAPLDAWAGLPARLARETGATVVAYDRAGFGGSDLGPAGLTPREQLRQLHQALTRLGVSPDRILVGHSYGGLLTLLYAHLYPDGLRGVVLVDPMNSRFVRATRDFVQSTVPHLAHPASVRDSAVARMVNSFDGLVADPDAGDGGLRLPLVVVTAGVAWWKKADIDRQWRASHQAMVQAAPHRRLVVADSADHDIPARRPDTIVAAVRSLMPGGPADE